MQPPDQPAPGEPTPVPPQVPPTPPSSIPGPGEPPPMVPPPPTPDSSKDDRTLAMIAHLGGIITSFIAPLIIWLMKKDTPGFVEDQAKEALNFQVTVVIGYIAWMVLTAIPVLGCLVAPAGIVVFLAALVFSILAGVKANEGVRYRYPVTLRLIK